MVVGVRESKEKRDAYRVLKNSSVQCKLQVSHDPVYVLASNQHNNLAQPCALALRACVAYAAVRRRTSSCHPPCSFIHSFILSLFLFWHFIILF